MAAPSHARARDDIAQLVHRSAGVQRLGRNMTRIRERAIPFDGASLTVDLATLLPTGQVVGYDVNPDLLPRGIEIELGEPDVTEV